MKIGIKKKKQQTYNCFLAADSCWLLSSDHLLLRSEAHSLAGGVSVQMTKAWVSHCNASSCLHQELASETLQAWKKGLSQGFRKRNIYSFCLEEPVIFKPHSDDYDINSWKIQFYLCSASESATILFLCISVQHIPLRTVLHVWVLKQLELTNDGIAIFVVRISKSQVHTKAHCDYLFSLQSGRI